MFGDQAGLLVVDYKTGPLPTEKDILHARNVQLPLYVEAAKTLLHNERPGSEPHADWLGGAFHRVGGEGEMRFIGRLSRRGRQYKLNDPPATPAEAPHHHMLQRITAHIHAMRHGDFRALPAADCPSYCPYRQICHVSPARTKIKTDAETRGPVSASLRRGTRGDAERVVS